MQKTMKKTDDPVLVMSDIKKKEETLTRVAEPIMTKPAPKPKVCVAQCMHNVTHVVVCHSIYQNLCLCVRA